MGEGIVGQRGLLVNTLVKSVRVEEGLSIVSALKYGLYKVATITSIVFFSFSIVIITVIIITISIIEY